MQPKNTERSRRARQDIRERRRSRRTYVPLLVLLGSAILLAIVWQMFERKRAEAAEPVPPVITSPVGTYDWDRESWLANAPAKPFAERLFSDLALVLELGEGGSASIGKRLPDGRSGAPEVGSWQRKHDGLQLDFAEVQFVRGKVTEVGLEFQAPESGLMRFIRR